MENFDSAIFDVGGVLISNKNGINNKDIQHELGLNDEKMRELWDFYSPTFGSGKISEADFWKEISLRLGIRLVTPEEDLFGKTFRTELEIHWELLAYVREIGKRGIKLAVLSDTNLVHANILKEAGVYEPFDKLFLSHETGIRKPDPEIYSYALNEIHADPARTIYIDDLPKNLKPATDLGMHTILATNPVQVIEDIKKTLK